MTEPLFRVVCAKPDETMLGYDWIEVLAIYPFRFGASELSTDIEGHEQYRDFTNWALVRTPHGIHRLGEDELMDEIEANVYVEARGLIVWDADTKTLKEVVSTCVNGQSIQLNAATWGEEQPKPEPKKTRKKKSA